MPFGTFDDWKTREPSTDEIREPEFGLCECGTPAEVVAVKWFGYAFRCPRCGNTFEDEDPLMVCR